MKINELFPNGRGEGHSLVLGELLLDFVPSDCGMGLAQSGAVIKTVSGAAGIFACAAALFGQDCRFLGKVGADPFSRLALSTIEEMGVDARHVIRAAEGKLGLAFLEYLPTGRNYIYYRDSSIGSMLRPEELPEEAFRGARLLHLPGMLLELSESMRQSCLRAVELAKAHGVLLSFDPNIRKELAGNAAARERLLGVLAQADMVEPTLEEGRLLTGKEELGEVLRELHRMGPKLVVLTRDKDGAVFSYGGEVLLCGGIDVPAVDPTGAGDTFAAALSWAVAEDMELERAIALCNCAGTLVCTKRGVIGMALPTREEVLDLLETGPCTVERVALSNL